MLPFTKINTFIINCELLDIETVLVLITSIAEKESDIATGKLMSNIDRDNAIFLA